MSDDTDSICTCGHHKDVHDVECSKCTCQEFEIDVHRSISHGADRYASGANDLSAKYAHDALWGD